MKAIVVISLECQPEDLPEVLTHLNPTAAPHFAGQVRIAIEDDAKYVEDWLEGDE